MDDEPQQALLYWVNHKQTTMQNKQYKLYTHISYQVIFKCFNKAAISDQFLTFRPQAEMVKKGRKNMG